MDLEKIKNTVPISEVIAKDVKLRAQGPDHWGVCPFHGDKNPSMQVTDSKGIYYCHGCQAHGDVFDYLMNSRKITLKEAYAVLGGEMEAGKFQGKIARLEHVDIYKDYKAITPPEGEVIRAGERTAKLFNPKRADDPQKRFTSYKPSSVYEYKSIKGQHLGYVLRVDFPDGKKITPCVQWCKRPDGTEGWTHKPFDSPRSLYNLDKEGGGQIFIAEGEKAAEAVGELLGVTCYTWAGGTKGVDSADWSPLKGKKIVIWPDADKVGIKAAEQVAKNAAKAGAESIKILYPPKDMAKGWDAADALAEGWDKAKVMEWGKPLIKEYTCKEKPKKVEVKKEPVKEKPEPLHEEPEIITPPISEADFKILGYNSGQFYYMPKRGQQLIELSASAHTKHNLFQLAPLEYWKTNYEGNKGNIKWDDAASALIDTAVKRGIFIPQLMRRGRGAWIDQGRKVLHLGDKVILDGEEFKPMDTPTKSIYEAAEPIRVKSNQALSSKEAHKLISICEAITWDNPLSGKLMAGLCVVAPICGILKWRPHAFITGESGSGKTTVVKRIITPMLGEFKIAVEGKTTEAGLRQRIKFDSVPVVFDEAESEDRSSAQRMQAIYDLARISSSGGEVLKGNVAGDGMAFSIRSLFIFSAINPAISHYADQTRITKFLISKDRSPQARERYTKLDNYITKTITEEYASSMILRAFDNIENLLKNIDIFTEAATKILTEKRYADQLAPMLAGAYLCHTKNVVTLEKAIEFIGQHDWGDHTAINVAKDGERLVEAIVAHRAKVSDGYKWHDETVGEMLVTIFKEPHNQLSELYKHELSRTGIKQDGDYFIVANRALPLAEILKETTWKNSWAQTLKTLSGTEATEPMYFSPGIKCRATKVPMHMITDNETRGMKQEEFPIEDLIDEYN